MVGKWARFFKTLVKRGTLQTLIQECTHVFYPSFSLGNCHKLFSGSRVKAAGLDLDELTGDVQLTGVSVSKIRLPYKGINHKQTITEEQYPYPSRNYDMLPTALPHRIWHGEYFSLIITHCCELCVIQFNWCAFQSYIQT